MRQCLGETDGEADGEADGNVTVQLDANAEG
jgi:hypothetical protein